MNCSAFGIVSLEYDEGIGEGICYHYTNEIYLIVPSLFVMTARPQCALWSKAANSFLALYGGGF
jgi:hypothetical protein